MNQRTFRHGFGTHSTSVIAFDPRRERRVVHELDRRRRRGQRRRLSRIRSAGRRRVALTARRSCAAGSRRSRPDASTARRPRTLARRSRRRRRTRERSRGLGRADGLRLDAARGQRCRAARAARRVGAPLTWPVAPMHATLLPTGKLLTHAGRLPSAPGTDPPSDPHDSTRVDLADVTTWSHAAVDHASEELLRLEPRAPLTRRAPCARWTRRTRNERPTVRPRPSEPLRVAGRRLAARLTARRSTLGGDSGDSLGRRSARARRRTRRWQRIPAAGLRRFDVALTLDRHDGGLARRRRPAHRRHFPDGARRARRPHPVGRVGHGARVAGHARLGQLGTSSRRGRASGAYSGSRRQTRPDEVLVLGGVDAPTSSLEAQRDGVRIDLSGAAPAVSPIAPMLFQRADADATLLADGTVLGVRRRRGARGGRQPVCRSGAGGLRPDQRLVADCGGRALPARLPIGGAAPAGRARLDGRRLRRRLRRFTHPPRSSARRTCSTRRASPRCGRSSRARDARLLRRAVHPADRGRDTDRARHARAPRQRDARRELGSALPGARILAVGVDAADRRPGERQRRAAGPVHGLRLRRGGRAVGRAGRRGWTGIAHRLGDRRADERRADPAPRGGARHGRRQALSDGRARAQADPRSTTR